jgi:hypothetical protein
VLPDELMHRLMACNDAPTCAALARASPGLRRYAVSHVRIGMPHGGAAARCTQAEQ